MSSCRKTQKAKILAHMHRYGWITTLIAAKRYDICRLSERIRELEEDGHHINKPLITRNRKTYTVYSLVEWKQARAA
jgi:hypothetical protein